jgi:hypothetical protein
MLLGLIRSTLIEEKNRRVHASRRVLYGICPVPEAGLPESRLCSICFKLETDIREDCLYRPRVWKSILPWKCHFHLHFRSHHSAPVLPRGCDPTVDGISESASRCYGHGHAGQAKVTRQSSILRFGSPCGMPMLCSVSTVGR